ncbi:MAG TPA: carboxypeptidase regulatory-like domain-containing protein [Thermoanaerobaculia bacterium]|nr:carboxypeptidase regulatory-like domain-containing protein [Thermoanaerobaculia bacterium]
MKTVIAAIVICLSAPCASAAISGFVVTEQGRPVAGARVVARGVERPEDRNTRMIAHTAEPAPFATTTTDAAGAFQIATGSASVAMLAVEANGYAPARELAAAADTEILVSLREERPRSGTIRSSSGPIGKASVNLMSDSGEILFTAQTDEHGRYTAPDPGTWAHGLCVAHPDFAPKCEYAYDSTQLSAGMVLDAGVSLTGRALDENGKPVAGARVFAGDWPVGVTAEDGSFTIQRAPATEKTVHVIAGARSGFAPYGSAAITLSAPRSISGTVRDSKGRGMSGVLVWAGSRDSASGASAVTSANGHYRIEGLAQDQYSLAVMTPATLDSGNSRTEADLRRKTSAQHDIMMKPANLIRGLVQNENSEPVAGAMIMISSDKVPLIYARGMKSTTLTNPAGRFRFPASGERATMLTAAREGYGAGTASIEWPASDVTITLPEGIEVRGVVVDPDGKPLAGAGIVAMAATTTLNTIPIATVITSGVMEPWTNTDSDGAFSIHLPTGLHDLGAWKKGFAASEGTTIDVAANAERLRMVLSPAVQISGRVVRRKGEGPLSGLVAAMDESGRGAQAEIRDDGSFVIDSLTPGSYMIMARVDDTNVTQGAIAPATNVRIELPSLVAVRGRVIDAGTGAPIASYTLGTSGTDFSHYDSNEVFDAEGKFSASVPAGNVELNVSAPGYTDASRSVIVTESKPVDEVEIPLTRGRRLHGRITSKDGAQIAGAAIEIEGVYSMDEITSDENGEWEMPAAGVGELRLNARKKGFVSTHQSVSAGAGDERVDITLSTGKTLRGRVVDTTGAPVAKARVYATSEVHDAESQNAESEADGTFTLGGLSAGHYSLFAEKKGIGKANLADVDISKVQPVTLTLSKAATGRIRGTIDGVSGAGWLMGMVYARNDETSETAQAGRDGSFVIEDAPTGEVEVVGMLMSAQKEASTRPVRVTVVPGGEVEVRLSVSGGATIGGTVTSAGQPVSFAAVHFTSGAGRWRSTTSENGAYEIAGLAPGRYSVSAGQDGGQSFNVDYEVSQSAIFDISMTQARIDGRVVDESGAPVPGADVTAGSAVGTDNSPSTTKTDAAGAFSILVSANKEYRVTASKAGFAAQSASVDPRASHAPVVMVLEKGEGVRVRIVDGRSGATLRGYVVVTDEQGRSQFRISPQQLPEGALHLPLPNGTYRISASASAFSSHSIRVRVPAPEQTIALTRGGTLVVNSSSDARELIKLVLPNGDEYVRCYCNGIAEIRLEGETTRVEHVAPGAYRMDVIGSNGAPARSYAVTIGEGQTSVVKAE